MVFTGKRSCPPPPHRSPLFLAGKAVGIGGGRSFSTDQAGSVGSREPDGPCPLLLLNPPLRQGCGVAPVGSGRWRAGPCLWGLSGPGLEVSPQCVPPGDGGGVGAQPRGS